MFEVIGNITKRLSTSARNDSGLVTRLKCFLRKSCESSKSVKSEIASPRSDFSEWLIAACAGRDMRASPEASQTTTCVSSRINTDCPTLPASKQARQYHP